MSKFGRVLSYVLTALVSALVAAFAVLLVMTPRVDKLDQLQALIDGKFIGEVDEEALKDGAAHGMIAALGDKWSYYIPADEFDAYQEQMSNTYVGIGITIQKRTDNQGFDILEVTPGGPAQAAGIQAGDVLIAVSGQVVKDMELTDVSSLVRGEEGTKVKLTVWRGEEELVISVERKTFQTPVATGKLLEGNIGLVTIENFDARCAQETIAAIESVIEQGATKLIFDVRNNPGGYKDELVKVLDYLLPEGALFRSELYDGTVEEDRSDAKCLEMPMAVLVNGDSYSAAEFFAAALQEYDWAEVVGQKTVGKGYFQSTFQLSDGSAVGLSIGKYYTPKGVSLADVGITPDKPVEVDDETAAKIYYNMLEPMDDPQIQAAVEILSEK